MSGKVLDGLTPPSAALRPPWTVPVVAKVVNGIPTLVLIGDDVGMYSEVGEVRRGEGPAVRVLAGTAHRPHEGDEATGLMVAHWARVETQP
ncbi:MAG: hypothetical protein ABI692_15605 [Terracoccus sp.]